MPYPSPAELIALYGEDQMSLLADRTGDFVADPEVIGKAIARADAEIDSHVGARYPLPLASVPEILRQLSSDIAVYRLATDGGALTNEHRQRYEDAVAHLRRLADGRAVLSLPPAGDEGGDDDAEGGDDGDDDGGANRSSGPRPLVAGGPERLFSRAQLRGH